MTALAGYWSAEGKGGAGEACQRMLRSQQIYAPAPAAVWSRGDIGLGRRLFSMMPEDNFDRAPAIGGDGALVLVADLRLDNRDELLRLLDIGSAEGKSLADAAVLMRAIERWEEGAVARILGDFAFALWDEGRQRLLLARDFLGQRPLHYARQPEFFAFASMPKGLHALPEVPRRPSRTAAADFLALLPEQPGGSFFEGVETVPPGAYVEITREGLRVTEYWQPDLTPLCLNRSEDYDEALRGHFDSAVSSRLRGTDGRVAAHLSAGLDSAAVAATAARLLKASGGTVTAFTAVPREGYDCPAPPHVISDEGPLAAAVAAMYPNIDHVLVRSSGRSPLDSLDHNFFLFERPVLNLCNLVWAQAINEEAKARKLSVLLTGSAGNMSFSYSGMTLLPRLLSRGRIFALARHCVSLLHRGVRAGTIASQALGPLLPVAAWRVIQRARGKGSDLSGHTMLSADMMADTELRARAAERGLDFSYRPRRDGPAARLWALRRTDMGNYNKGILAGWGIDVRDPTADRRLVEFCLRVPEEQYLAGGFPRGFARRAFAGSLPAELLHQQRKGLQSVDWHEGLSAARNQLSEEVEAIGHLPEGLSILDTERLGALIERWPEQGWEKPETVGRYRLGLLRGISAGHFLRRSSGANR